MYEIIFPILFELQVMFGDFVAFEQLWQYFLLFRPAGNVLKCVVFATYVMKPVFQECETPLSVIVLLAVSLLGKTIWKLGIDINK